jgi:hypothetical protein
MRTPARPDPLDGSDRRPGTGGRVDQVGTAPRSRRKRGLRRGREAGRGWDPSGPRRRPGGWRLVVVPAPPWTPRTAMTRPRGRARGRRRVAATRPARLAGRRPRRARRAGCGRPRRGGSDVGRRGRRRRWRRAGSGSPPGRWPGRRSRPGRPMGRLARAAARPAWLGSAISTCQPAADSDGMAKGVGGLSGRRGDQTNRGGRIGDNVRGATGILTGARNGGRSRPVGGCLAVVGGREQCRAADRVEDAHARIAYFAVDPGGVDGRVHDLAR